MPQETTSASDLAAQVLLVLGGDVNLSPATARGSADVFRRGSREQLLDCAKRLGLTKISRLTKEALARRVQEAFERLPTPTPTPTPAPVAAADPDVFSSFPAKFDLGPDAEQAEPARHIPWGYEQDRVTAMVVDPERMFVYWEVTDEAMARARRELGRGGDNAWLNVRVYDVTGRLFDGTNAHSYFDHKVERGDRQWFFELNKPTSMACVEVGMRSTEGFFVKIARSGRVEFPRREPVGGHHVEWLTVRSASGYAGDPVVGGAPGLNGGGGATGVGGATGGDGGGEAGDAQIIRVPGWSNGHAVGGGPAIERHWEWREGEAAEWRSELQSVAWTGPVVRSTWEAGPFTYPIEAPGLVEEHSSGQITTRTSKGQVHVVYGPWQVVIRGVGARAERRTLATWQVYHSWATEAGAESQPTEWRQLAPGSSEWVAMGGSERSWMFGSELRLGGASEVFFLGASELRLLGASETLYAGSSEYRFRGASELLYAGASEWSYRGASENLYAGASERMFAGASESAGRDYPAGAGASESAPPRQYPERG